MYLSSMFFSGIGWAVVLIAFYTDFFYNVIISWALYYLFASFTSELPWTKCGDWATEDCFSGHMNNEKYPVCEYKARIPICDEYRLCFAPNTSCSIQNFSYPTLDRTEALISSFKPMVNDLFNVNNTYYDNITDSVLMSNGTMLSYCNWIPKTTSPAAEYFQ